MLFFRSMYYNKFTRRLFYCTAITETACCYLIWAGYGPERILVLVAIGMMISFVECTKLLNEWTMDFYRDFRAQFSREDRRYIVAPQNPWEPCRQAGFLIARDEHVRQHLAPD